MDKRGFAQGKSKHMEAEGLFAYSSGKNEWNEGDQSTSAAVIFFIKNMYLISIIM